MGELESLNTFLQQNALYLALGAVLLVVLAIILISRPHFRKRPQIPDFSALIAGLGGISNIVSAQAKGSRLIVKLRDDQAVDIASLTLLGYSHFVRMTLQITIVLGEGAEAAAQALTSH